MTNFRLALSVLLAALLLAGCPRGVNAPPNAPKANAETAGLIERCVKAASRPVQKTLEEAEARGGNTDSPKRTLAAIAKAGEDIRPKVGAWLAENPTAPASEKLRITETFLDDRLAELGYQIR